MLSRSLRRLAGTVTPAPAADLRFKLATVAAVTAGAAADGNAAVSVNLGSDVIPAPYLASYTPAVADMVAVLLVNSSPIILGRVIGLPAF